MQYIADLHIHSRFSRATSSELNFLTLYEAALEKGIQIVGTGDFTHPGWFQEMQENLIPAPEPGLFQLKPSLAEKAQAKFPSSKPVRFLLSVEISSIYKKKGKVRKIHNIVFAPDWKSAQGIQQRLSKIGNLKSDGRPILGLDSHDLLEILLEVSPECYLIPAHIWTPWFALFGSKSGFDHIDECFGDLTKHIFALETGLSSDPAMNWLCSQLDRFVLVSNSDAHSASKLGREANLFDTDFSYQGLFSALKDGDPKRFLGTLEFYPEEGKYHLDGHRKCNQCLTPEETRKNNGICPVCQKPLTLGVMYRVMELADRLPGQKPDRTFPFSSIAPLEAILAELLEVGASSRKVQAMYQNLIHNIGPELAILHSISLDEIASKTTPLFAEAIRRVRQGQIQIQAGYDGEYGVIQIFKPGEKQQFESQDHFMGWNAAMQSVPTTIQTASHPLSGPGEILQKGMPSAEHTEPRRSSLPPTSPATEHTEPRRSSSDLSASPTQFPVSQGLSDIDILHDLNQEQQETVISYGYPLLVIAGPGTGKTRTLTSRIAYSIAQKRMQPEQILAITFTNKAAQEMQQRLQMMIPHTATYMLVVTFHGLGWKIIQEQRQTLNLPDDLVIVDTFQKEQLLQSHPHLSKALDKIEQAKNSLLGPEQIQDQELAQSYQQYQQALQNNHSVDLDDLLFIPVQLFRQHPEILKTYQERFVMIAVDEYQDLNDAQYQLLRLLVTEKSDFMAIGDPDQAIYGFRGAKVHYFSQFQQDFAGTKVIHLRQNYRSTQQIIQAAQAVIAHNPHHISNDLQTNVSGLLLQFHTAATGKSEAEFVVKTIEQLLGGTSNFSMSSGRSDGQSNEANYSFQSFAILYRTAAQTPDLEEALVRSGMPYQVVGSRPFWQQPRMKTWYALLQVLAYPHRDWPLSYILSQMSGLGKRSLEIITHYAKEHQLSIFDFLEKVSAGLLQAKELPYTASRIVTSFFQRLKKWQEFLRIHSDSMIESNANSCLVAPAPSHLQDEKCDMNVRNLLQNILSAVTLPPALVDDSLSMLYLNAEELEILLHEAEGFKNIPDFLSHIDLHQASDDYNAHVEKITLMTLHAAKGLEFPVVFLVGCEDELLPFLRYDHSLEHIEEERRLFYVGMTRAKERLYLVYARERILQGKTYQNVPSRFWTEVPSCMQEMIVHTYKKKSKDKPNQQQIQLF